MKPSEEGFILDKYIMRLYEFTEEIEEELEESDEDEVERVIPPRPTIY